MVHRAWRLQNVGTCTWGPGYELAFYGGRSMGSGGVAFGLLQGIGPLVGWLSVGILGGMFIYLVRLPQKMWLLRLGLALLIGGAAGNLVDRILVGAVLDFVETPLRGGIFNLADVAINVGVALVLLGLLWSVFGAEEVKK